jgi:hypothetical protein
MWLEKKNKFMSHNPRKVGGGVDLEEISLMKMVIEEEGLIEGLEEEEEEEEAVGNDMEKINLEEKSFPNPNYLSIVIINVNPLFPLILILIILLHLFL